MTDWERAREWIREHGGLVIAFALALYLLWVMLERGRAVYGL